MFASRHKESSVSVLLYLFGVRILVQRAYTHHILRETLLKLRLKTQMVLYECWLLLIPNCTPQISFKLQVRFILSTSLFISSKLRQIQFTWVIQKGGMVKAGVYHNNVQSRGRWLQRSSLTSNSYLNMRIISRWVQHITLSSWGGLSDTMLEIFFLENEYELCVKRLQLFLG